MSGCAIRQSGFPYNVYVVVGACFLSRPVLRRERTLGAFRGEHVDVPKILPLIMFSLGIISFRRDSPKFLLFWSREDVIPSTGKRKAPSIYFVVVACGRPLRATYARAPSRRPVRCRGRFVVAVRL